MYPKGMRTNQVLLILLLAGCCYLSTGSTVTKVVELVPVKRTSIVPTSLGLAKQTSMGFRRPLRHRTTQKPTIEMITSTVPSTSTVAAPTVDKIVCQMEALQSQATELERTIFLVPILIMYWFRSYKPNQAPSQSDIASFLAHMDESRVKPDERRSIFRMFEATKGCYDEKPEEGFYDEPRYMRISSDAYQSAGDFLSTVTPVLGCSSKSTEKPHSSSS